MPSAIALPSTPAPTDRRLPFLPALDGVRALAVVAVLLYHADVAWVPGGFLGVEVFFVLSGYLITALLWSDWQSGGRIALGAFYARRARRLLPALGVLLLAVTAAFVAGWPGEVARVRGDIAAATGYVSNWYLVGVGESYFEALGRPSPLRHLWSLAIEEQFYLLWPLALGLLAARLRRPGRVAAATALAAGASAAAVWFALPSGGDPSRAYYGTDTRAAGLFLGAALAIVWRPFARPERPYLSPRALDAIVAGSLAALVAGFAFLDEFSVWTYRPGLAAVGVATAALVGAAVHPDARIGARLLGWAPLRALGRRAYAIYLWHWPVFVVTRPEVDLAWHPAAVFALRVALTLALAEASYRFVEEPFRRGLLGRTARAVLARARRSPQRARAIARSWVFASAPVAIAVAALGVAVVRAVPAQTAMGATPPILSLVPPVAAAAPVASQAAVPQAVASADPLPTPLGRWAEERRRPPPSAARVVAVGDSVMLGARYALRDAIPGVLVDAALGRRPEGGIAALGRIREAGRLGDTVVLHLGNNGILNDDHFEGLMAAVADVERVFVVDVRVPRRWEDYVNRTLEQGVEEYGNAILLDWRARSYSCPGEVFASDGVHLTASGAACYATLIAEAL